MEGDPQFFVRARPKKSTLPPLPKKRKRDSKVEEVTFDFSQREEYLTGFHKRKVERIKRAQAENEKKLKEEKIQQRKELREERRKELEEHVAAVNALLANANTDYDTFKEDGDDGEWGGISDEVDAAPVDPIDHEEEYIDEDKYTTVTIEEVDVDKDGIHTLAEEERAALAAKKRAEAAAKKAEEERANKEKQRKVWPKKEKKKPFRYESKIERKLGRAKQKSKNSRQAKSRKGEE